ncbi:MAG: hypothetical protein HYU51_10585 [Candidatus Rokubacteria bacterium]|nr:hypothetical protein [Candidatus Rokubacteria bacterium]
MSATRMLGMLLAIVTVLVSAAGVQAQAPGSPAAPPPSGTAADGGFAGAAAVLLALLALFVVVGIGVKFYDLRRKRETEAVHLQAQISDALLRDQVLFGLPITPTVNVPTWSGSPAVIEVSGQVPTAETKDAALRIVDAEARRIRPDFLIEDRMAIVVTMERRAA